jgi:hypothetical protein
MEDSDEEDGHSKRKLRKKFTLDQIKTPKKLTNSSPENKDLKKGK